MNHDVVNEIQAMLDGAKPPVTNDCCIYRVPFALRKLNEDAYTPNVVSIGPFPHRTLPRLQSMERQKLIYCKAFLERPGPSLKTFIDYIENVEPKFRRCYSETLELPKEDLVKLILVDSCFILELFWRSYYEEWSDDDHAFLSKPWAECHIKVDLLLLENQLPYFVLEDLYNLAFSSSAHGNRRYRSFRYLTFDYFDLYNRSKLDPHDISSIWHFTDLIRIFHLQHPERRSPRIDQRMKHLHSATELLEAGVKFKVNTKSDCILDLSFSGRVLEIPQLNVDDWTEALFRNMMALELCHYPYQAYITDYVAVLDFLINTGRDVDILLRKRILVNFLGDSDSVANMVNRLWKNIAHMFFNFEYLLLCENLNAFCRDPFNKRKATLRRDYGSTPWQTVTSIAGILLIILTVLQSVCSVLQVVLR